MFKHAGLLTHELTPGSSPHNLLSQVQFDAIRSRIAGLNLNFIGYGTIDPGCHHALMNTLAAYPRTPTRTHHTHLKQTPDNSQGATRENRHTLMLSLSLPYIMKDAMPL